MSRSKSGIALRKDSEGKSLFTWKQFRSPLNNNSGSVCSTDIKNVEKFEILGEDSPVDEQSMSGEQILLKEANSNLVKKVLQREKECQDLEERLLMSSRTNSDLLAELEMMGTENQRLRLQALALQEENDLLHSQLSVIRRSYSNYSPTSTGTPYFSPWNPGKFSGERESIDIADQQHETWEDISERLLQQMQQEMRQMEDLSHKLSLNPRRTETSLPNMETSKSGHISKEEVNQLCPKSEPSSLSRECELECARSMVHHLKSQVEHLKTQMVTQGAVLRSALGQVHKFCAADPALHIKTRGLSQSSQGSDNPSSGSKFSRPSDELFRAYFTQQLHSSASTVVAKPPDSEAKTVPATSSEDVSSNKLIGLSNTQSKADLHEKVCPMCEITLPPETLQADFENHVFGCLDRENSTLLLEQYEMV